MLVLFKKIGWIYILIVIGVQLLHARDWNLGNPELVEKFGLGIVGKKIDIYDPDSLGEWVLKTYYRKKYNRTHDDEFEFDSAKQWALQSFKKRIGELNLPSNSDNFHLYLNAKFGKYDFKNRRFPLDALTKDSYISYRGKGNIVSYYSRSKLFFENASQDKNFLYIPKDQARLFVAKRKSSGGYINRDLIIHYVYKLNNAQENDEFSPDGSKMSIDFTGKILYMDIMDKDKKTVIQRIKF